VEEAMEKADKEVDVCGVCCPMPLIKVRTALNDMQAGQVLSVTGDDPIFEESVHDLCDTSGLQVLATERDGRRVTMQIRK
jgi:TusA-related sulfurtransferase